MKRRGDILRISKLSGLESSIVDRVVQRVCDDILLMLLAGDAVRLDGLGVFATRLLPATRRKVRAKNGEWVMRDFTETTLIKFRPSVKITGA